MLISVRKYWYIDTEVKQVKTKANSKMSDQLGSMHFIFFQFGWLAEVVGKFAKFFAKLSELEKRDGCTKLISCNKIRQKRVDFDLSFIHIKYVVS